MKLTPDKEKQMELEAQRIIDVTERRRKANVVIAIVLLPIFLLWLVFSIYVANLGCLTEWYMWISGPVTGLLGTALTAYMLWANWDRERFWTRKRDRMDRFLSKMPSPEDLCTNPADMDVPY